MYKITYHKYIEDDFLSLPKDVLKEAFSYIKKLEKEKVLKFIIWQTIE